MSCYVTLRDIRTRFNPNFHILKIKNIQNEIEEMYHIGTTVTNYDYSLGVMNIRSKSAEDAALDILSKREHLDRLLMRHERYLEIHEQALEKVIRYASEVELFQSSLYTLDEVAEIFGVSRERIRRVLYNYRKAVSDMMTNDDTDSDIINDEEVEQLSAIIEANVMYAPESVDKKLDPLHGMAEWLKKDKDKRRKRKAKMSVV